MFKERFFCLQYLYYIVIYVIRNYILEWFLKNEKDFRLPVKCNFSGCFLPGLVYIFRQLFFSLAIILVVIESNQLIAKLIAKLFYCQTAYCQTITFQSEQQQEKQTHTRFSKLQYQILQQIAATAHTYISLSSYAKWLIMNWFMTRRVVI